MYFRLVKASLLLLYPRYEADAF